MPLFILNEHDDDDDDDVCKSMRSTLLWKKNIKSSSLP